MIYSEQMGKDQTNMYFNLENKLFLYEKNSFSHCYVSFTVKMTGDLIKYGDGNFVCKPVLNFIDYDYDSKWVDSSLAEEMIINLKGNPE